MNWRTLILGLLLVLLMVGVLLTLLGSSAGTPELAIIGTVAIVAIVLIVRGSRRAPLSH